MPAVKLKIFAARPLWNRVTHIQNESKSAGTAHCSVTLAWRKPCFFVSTAKTVSEKEFSKMLVLSRKSAADLVFPSLGSPIRVLKTGSNCVKLGVIAPKQTRAVRDELVGSQALKKLDHLVSFIYEPHRHPI
jgi:sRNA-binding carbon storage regulator CsrA